MPDIPFYHQAIQELAPTLTFQIKGNDFSTLVSRNGVALPSESDIDAEVIKLEATYNAQEYARNRATEYPSTGEQLDYIFHNGVAKWKTDMIEPVKAKYPKPS